MIALFKLLFFVFVVLLSHSSDVFAVEKLKFSEKAKKYSGGSIGNVVFAPSKESNNTGRALVLLPSCDGIKNNSVGSYKEWIRFFTEQGYTVLMVDHYQPRGIPAGNGCQMLRKLDVKYDLPLDVIDAVEHLNKTLGIDKNKIFSLGFSLGTMANAVLASKAWYENFGEKRLRPRALGGLYGACRIGTNIFLHSDINLPLIWLMGSKDNDTPPIDCTNIIKEIENRKEVKIVSHIYEGATHCWDCRDKNGFTETKAHNGNTVTYMYNSKVTKDSMIRAVEFFNSFK